MKRLFIVVLLNLIMVFFSACDNIEINFEETIKPPDSNYVALEGTWEIEKYISVKTDEGDSQNSISDSINNVLVGSKAIFDSEISAIGQDVCINPQYRVIRTDSDIFFQNKYRISDTSLGFAKEEIGVITITTNNRTFYELITTDKMHAYIYMDNGFLLLTKVSETVDTKIKEIGFGNVGKNIQNGEYTEDPLLRSGVLIGVRAADNNYRTIWVYSKNREIKTVSMRQQIIVPRLKGFWELQHTDKGEADIINSGHYVEPKKEMQIKDIQINEKQELYFEKGNTKIIFVGNDYFGIEYNSKYKVISFDNLNQTKDVVLSDVIGNDSETLIQSRDAFINKLHASKRNKIIKVLDETNFTLNRRNGRWVMKSRLYFEEPIANRMYEDFDLNEMVPEKLIHYDKMDIPWTEIKSKLPWIKDAYMSPNKDIAILVSEDSLNIYPVKNKALLGKQLMKLPLSKGESIIMTEWSVGKYADIWGEFTDGFFTQTRN